MFQAVPVSVNSKKAARVFLPRKLRGILYTPNSAPFLKHKVVIKLLKKGKLIGGKCIQCSEGKKNLYKGREITNLL